MVHARKRWALQAAAMIACAGIFTSSAIGATAEPRIIATVYPTLSPTSAIPVPVIVRAEQSNVWKSDLEQRMLVSGHVVIEIGYRSMRADTAAIWLTPSRESGENTYDVAIYLSGNVRVYEGDRSTSTVTSARELLVTTRISRSAQLEGTPVSKSQQESQIVRRGDELREELINRPPAMVHIPTIVITSAEEALQAGWIAKGPNNRIIAGPGDVQIVRGPDGKILPTGIAPGTPRKTPPKPAAFVTFEKLETRQMGNEWVTIVHEGYLLLDRRDGSPPMELRAQRMVLFSPPPEKGANPTTAPAKDAAGQLSRVVTGIYLEGDVTLNSGEREVRADRLYFDVTSYRAVMLDAVLSAVDDVRNVPVYMRAEEIRMLSRTEYAAKKATFSTSEFYTPHYHIGASDIYLQDLAPRDENNHTTGLPTYAFGAKNATINILGVPVFYWPYLSGNTSTSEIPLRRIRFGNSKRYGLSIQTDWDLFALAGQVEPKGLHADLTLDYFGKRGPAGGVDADWRGDDYHGFLRSYALQDKGTDDLGVNRDNVPVEDSGRGRVVVRHQQDLGDGLTLQLEGAYISDPNFLQEFFNNEYVSDKEQETSIYIKKQNETSALTLLGKFTLMDFTTIADQVDDQYTTQKKPEAKYWRIGDSFFDMFTYYSESGVANMNSSITNYTPTQLALLPSFLGLPAAVPAAVAPNTTYLAYYKAHGWTTDDVVRGDTRQEIDLPLQVGDAKITPYATARLTAWDAAFPDTNADGTPNNGDTTRVQGAVGLRSSMEFWRVYNDVESTYFDVHRIRHVIEPTFNIYESGSNQERRNLQPFDRDVEGINNASGMQLSLNQKWQTKRGGEGHWRNVDWITLDIGWNQFWNRDKTEDQPQPGLPDTRNLFFAGNPIRGYYFASRPELSLAANSINVNSTWRAGERMRVIGETDFGLDSGKVEQFATGLAVDQTDTLAYFLGNRYIRLLNTNQITVGADYQLTQKYRLIATESYDTGLQKDILSAMSIVRKLPRFNFALTLTYDANNGDTSVVFTAWPEGLPDVGFGDRTVRTPHDPTPNP